MVLNKNKDVVAPVILYIDKTRTDVHWKLTLEPVSFTLGIFNRKIWNQLSAWRLFGYINSSDRRDTFVPAGPQYYHTMLQSILFSLQQVQEHGGVNWKLQHRNIVYDVNLKFPLLMVLG